MNRNRLNILLVVTALLVLSGCGDGGGKTGGKSADATAPSNSNAASVAPTPAEAANVSAPSGAAVAPAQPAANAVVAQPVASQGGGTRGGNNAPPAKMPTPRIGSGGNDFYLFTQARGALNADAELKAANVVVDVKEGAVTLNGTVKSAEQKSKAEQLVRAVGSKSVKNQLRVSGGN
jgi:hypothetical protein